MTVSLVLSHRVSCNIRCDEHREFKNVNNCYITRSRIYIVFDDNDVVNFSLKELLTFNVWR